MDRCTKFWRKIEIPGGDFCHPRQSKRQHLTFIFSCCIHFKGPVQFTSKGDRMGYMKIEQLQG